MLYSIVYMKKLYWAIINFIKCIHAYTMGFAWFIFVCTTNQKTYQIVSNVTNACILQDGNCSMCVLPGTWLSYLNLKSCVTNLGF